MWKYNQTDELYHWGVLGMRWGHRKSKIAESREYRKGRKEFNKNKKMNALKEKWAAKDKAKQDKINKVDSKINKAGSVSKFKNSNRAGMIANTIGAAAGIGAVGTASKIGLAWKYRSPAGQSYVRMMTKTGEKLAKDRKSLNLIKRFKAVKATKEYIKDSEMLRKDAKKWKTVAAVGSVIVAGYAAKKIYDKHKENKIANDYEYRKSLKKKSKKK